MAYRTFSNAAQTAKLPPGELTVFHRRYLHRLLELGETLAELTVAHAQREAAENRDKPSDGTLATFDRVSRTMRRTIMLDRMLNEPLPVRRDNPANSNRPSVIRDVAPQRTNGRDADAERHEQPERLERPDFYIDLSKRPISAIIADIEHDLGLQAPLADTITIEEVEAAYEHIAEAVGEKPKSAPSATKPGRASHDSACDRPADGIAGTTKPRPSG